MERKSKLRVPGKEDPEIVPEEILSSGTLRIDLADQRVTIAGAPVALQPKVYELLVLLLSEPQRVHTREALFERLWPQSVVLDANLTTAISQLRKALTPPLRERLRTLPRVGYAWDAEVERSPRVRAAASAEMPEPRGPADPHLAHVEADPNADPDAARAAATSAQPHVALHEAAPSIGTAASPAPPRRWPAPGRPALALLLAGGLAAAGLLGWALWQRPASGQRAAILLEEVEIADRADPRAWMAPMVAESLRRHLELSPRLRVLGADDSAGLVAAASALGGADGADYRLQVRLVPAAAAPSRMALQASLFSAEGVSQTWRVPVGEHGLIPAAQTLALRVAARLTGEPLQQLQAITPTALREYEAGMRAETLSAPDDARAAYQRAIGLSPGFCAARIRLAKVLVRQGLDDLGAAQWRAASACADLGPEARGEAQAQALALSGRPLEAAAVFDALAERFPDAPAHRLAAIDARIQNGGAALEEAARALATLDPLNHDAPTRIRQALLQARLHRARGEDAEEFAAYRRLAEMTTVAGAAIFHADAQFQLGTIHRRRGDADAAREAFRRAAAAFRAAGSEANAQVADLNVILLAEADGPARKRDRAAALERFALRAAAAGNSETAGQALDAAAMDAWSAGEAERARTDAQRAAGLLAHTAPARKLGPEITLAFLDLRSGDAEASLRRLLPLRAASATERQLELLHLRVEAWMAQGRPLRAQQHIDATRREWSGAQVPAARRSTLACIEVGVALARGAAAAARSALAQCGASGAQDVLGMWPERGELAALDADADGVRRADLGWAEAVGRLDAGPQRNAALMELSRFRLEHGDYDGAARLLQSLDGDTLAGLPPPVSARYWLNLSLLAAARGDRRAVRDALGRADRAIGARPGALRREHALLTLADRAARDPQALSKLRADAEADALHLLALRAARLDAQWKRGGDPMRDLAWWHVGPGLR